MSSPRRNTTLIELIRDRSGPTRTQAGPPVRAPRVRPEAPGRPSREGRAGFDAEALRGWLSPGRRLNLPMGYVLIALALVLISWIGMYMIGYSRAESTLEAERIAALTTTADPLMDDRGTGLSADRAQGAGALPPRESATRPTPRVSSSGPTGTGLPRAQSNAAANRPASVLPPAEFESGLNYLIVANYHREEAQRAAAYLLDNGIRATVIPVRGGASWRVVCLGGFTGEQMRSGDHREQLQRMEELGKAWERDHGGPDNFGQMFFRKWED